MDSPSFIRNSLKARITLATLAIFMISIWSLALYASRMLREDMETLLSEQQFSTASFVAREINDELADRLQMLGLLAGKISPALLHNMPALQIFLEDRPVMQSQFNGGLIVYRMDGMAIAETPVSAERIGVNYMDIISVGAALKEGKSTISRPVIGKKLQAPVIGMTAPIRDTQGKVIGAISGVINLGLPNFIDKTANGRYYGKTGGYVLVASQYRLIVTATDKRRIMEQLRPPGAFPLIDRFISGYEGSGIFVNPVGVEVLQSSMGIPVAGWYVGVQLPVAEVFAPIRALQQRMLWAATLLSVLAGSLTWWWLRRQLSPMLSATTALAIQLDNPHELQPLPISSHDEIGQLVGAFNRLLETLSQREVALKKSEQKLAITLDSIGDAVIVTDPAGRVTRMNPTAERMTGWTLAEAMGHDLPEVFNIINSGTREAVADPVQSVIAHGQVVGLANHTVLLARDGKEYQIADSAAPILNATREIIGVVLVFSDVTEKCRSEKALCDSESRFRTMFEHNETVMLLIAADSGEIVDTNEAAARFYGYSTGHLKAMRIDQINTLSPDEIAERRTQEASHKRNIFEFPHRLASGEVRLVEVHSSPLEVGGRTLLFSIIHDITTRRHAEAQLVVANKKLVFQNEEKEKRAAELVVANKELVFQNEEKEKRAAELDEHRNHLEELVDFRTGELTAARDAAEIANITKDAFLANMSHELRTPLSAVIGIANLAQGISTEPKLRDYLDKIVKSGKHLNRIINELLDLSKIAAGHMELEIMTFSLRTVITHVESVMSHRAAEKGLAIVLVIDDAVPDVLLGDPTRVTQILLNLIGNAIKFTQIGRVTVRIGLQTSEENRVCLDVDFEDTGIGMRPEELKQLFKPFTQADASVSRKFGGTGLGLTISRRLAEMMHGDISVTSVEGSGTTFKVRIWLGLGNAADLPPADSAGDEVLPLCYQDVRILVADDQPLNREIAEALLVAVGITPGMAANGQDVLDILSEAGPDAFDLVLMDIQMPIIDGHTATRTLRSRAGFETLPIIAMTAHTMAHEQELNAAAGMNDHIGKPFDNASFYRTLAKWIPKSKQEALRASDELPELSTPLAEAGNELSTLHGVDVAVALARFGGNEDRYRHWLAEFVATSGEIPDQIRSEITAGQRDMAGETAHAFKGRVGMLGMTDLHGIVCALESVLHDGTPTDEPISRLEQSINQMRDELARVNVVLPFVE